jgi:hypothetical protein
VLVTERVGFMGCEVALEVTVLTHLYMGIKVGLIQNYGIKKRVSYTGMV